MTCPAAKSKHALTNAGWAGDKHRHVWNSCSFSKDYPSQTTTQGAAKVHSLSLKSYLSGILQAWHEMRIKLLGFMPLHTVSLCRMLCASCSRGCSTSSCGLCYIKLKYNARILCCFLSLFKGKEVTIPTLILYLCLSQQYYCLSSSNSSSSEKLDKKSPSHLAGTNHISQALRKW